MQSATKLSALVQAFQHDDFTAKTSETPIGRALKAVRAHLGMEVAYVSEFMGDRTVFREVDAPGLEALIKVGDSQSLNDVYCRHILAGRLPSLMPDTSAVPFARALPITAGVPIGKHMSIPLRMADGTVYGMFCCLGPAPDASLNPRDLNTMNVFAEFAAFELQREFEVRRVAAEKLRRISDALEAEQLSIAYQPIYCLRTERHLGFECLARFETEPYRTPDVWFKEAGEIDRGPFLELAVVTSALAGLSALPGHVYLAVNTSPDTIMSSEFVDTFNGIPLDRIVLEITEHAHVNDYASLLEVIAPLRRQGMRLAVDDAGSGYSSLQHILQLQPDVIKLDISLTSNIDQDRSRRALAAALIAFAGATDCKIVAEGVETATELQVLKGLGVHMGQGYFLGRPMPLAAASSLGSNRTATD